MDIQDLYKFKIIAEEQNITRAAERLYTSQPALSYVLNKLEDELGAALFDRSKNGITLNEKGRTALEHVNIILTEAEEMKQALKDDNAPQIRIISSMLASIRYFVSKYMSEYPDVNVTTGMENQKDLLRLLLAGKADVAISAEPLRSPEMDCMPFYEEHAMIGIPKGHPLHGEKKISLRQLEGETLYTVKNIGYFGSLIEDYIKKEKLNINTYLFDDQIIFYAAMKNRPLLFLLNSISLNYTELSSESWIADVTDEGTRCTCYACCLRKNRKKCGPFIDWIKEAYRSEELEHVSVLKSGE